MSSTSEHQSTELPMDPAPHTNDESEPSVALGSEDSDTDGLDSVDSSDEDIASSDESANENVPTSTQEENAEGNNGENDDDGDDEAPNYGQLIDGDRGYIHPDGRQEIWYRQPVPGNPEAPGWTTLNAGPLGPPAASTQCQKQEEDLNLPVPVGDDELPVAVAETKEDIPELDIAAQYCTCASSSVLRASSELPYLNHEQGWWVDPSVKQPLRATQRFHVRKGRKSADTPDGFAPANTPPSPTDNKTRITLSWKVPVPACDVHFPITGVSPDDWKFVHGSRYIKMRVRAYNTQVESETDSSLYADVRDDDTNDGSRPGQHTEGDHKLDADARGIGAGENSTSLPDATLSANQVDPSNTAENSKVELETEAEESDAKDEDNAPTYIQYTDQAYRLRLICDDPATDHRQMSIHAPPVSWEDRASIKKLNRWLYVFRLRSRIGAEPTENAQTEKSKGNLKGKQKAADQDRAVEGPAAAADVAAPADTTTTPGHVTGAAPAADHRSTSLGVGAGASTSASKTATSTPITDDFSAAPHHVGTPASPFAPTPSSRRRANPVAFPATPAVSSASADPSSAPPALPSAHHSSAADGVPNGSPGNGTASGSRSRSRSAVPRLVWTRPELSVVRDGIAAQMRASHSGRYQLAPLQAALEARWPARRRSTPAIARTAVRHRLVEQARVIAMGEDGSAAQDRAREQSAEEADRGEADAEDEGEVEEGGGGGQGELEDCGESAPHRASSTMALEG